MRKFKLMALAAAAALLGFTAPPASFAQTTNATTGTQVTVSDNVFTPGNIGVTAGTTVTWTNYGTMPHTVTADNGAFDSGDIASGGGTFSYTFNTPGVYAYYCKHHGAPGGIGMSGVVTVTAASDNAGNSSSTTGSNLTVTNNNTSSTTTSTVVQLLAPTNVSATSTSSSGINLTWTDANINASTSSSTVTGFNIIRNGSQVATSTGTSFSDTGLSANTTYAYNIAAFDNSGNTSPWSATAYGTTMAETSTSTGSSTASSFGAPTNLMATAVSSSQINLAWTAPIASSSSSTIASYTIYRNGAQAGTATSTNFSDTGLASGTMYTYTVSATDNGGMMTGQSASATATTLTSGGTGTTTPPTNPGMVWGWAAIPLSVFNQLSGTATSTNSSTTPSSPFTYNNGYPMLNGNYVDCSGNIDNDPAHHVTDPNDHDPAHHVGMSCPNGGMPVVYPQNYWPGTNNNQGAPQSFIVNMLNGSGGVPWVVIPLTASSVQNLMNVINSGSLTTP